MSDNTTRFTEADYAEIARCITHYTELFRAQVERAGGWPAKFRFPKPSNALEREALRLFLAETEIATGVRVTITHKA